MMSIVVTYEFMEIYPGIKDKFAYFAVKLSLLGTVHRLVLAKTGKNTRYFIKVGFGI